MEVTSERGMLRYVERQVPRHVKSVGGELANVSEVYLKTTVQQQCERKLA
jgi:hypothetical protein